MRVAEAMIEEAREITERGESDELTVLSAGDRDVEMIKFRDVSIEKDKYVTKVWPTSLLPDTPQGKIQTVTELAQVDPRIGAHASMLLTSIPDLDAVVSRINAPYELVTLYLDNMIERGVYDPPLPYMDLAMVQQESQLRLLQAHKDNVAEERLDLVRRFMDEAAALAEAAAAPPAAAPGPAGPGGPPAPGPMGPGGPPPPGLPAAAPASIPGGPAALPPPV